MGFEKTVSGFERACPSSELPFANVFSKCARGKSYQRESINESDNRVAAAEPLFRALFRALAGEQCWVGYIVIGHAHSVMRF